MSTLMHRAASVFSLMSRIPVRLKEQPDYSDADLLIPLVGLTAALAACAGAAVGVFSFGPGWLAAITATAVQYAAFNLFHFDGLVDSADAMGAFGDAEKKRIALKDPRIGSFGLFSGALALLCRVAALAALFRTGGLLAWAGLAMAPVVGRFSSCILAGAYQSAPGGGLGSTLSGSKPLRSSLGYAFAIAPGALLLGAAAGPFAVGIGIAAGGAIAAIASIAVGQWYKATFGGYTGDALGAAVELGELFVLCVMAGVFARGF